MVVFGDLDQATKVSMSEMVHQFHNNWAEVTVRFAPRNQKWAIVCPSGVLKRLGSEDTYYFDTAGEAAEYLLGCQVRNFKVDGRT